MFKQYEELFRGVKITFSRNCRSGLLERCECWRCRQKRGESVNEETEARAVQQAMLVDERHRLSMKKFIEEIQCQK